jgi:hypothetical protein
MLITLYTLRLLLNCYTLFMKNILECNEDCSLQKLDKLGIINVKDFISLFILFFDFDCISIKYCCLYNLLLLNAKLYFSMF